MSKENSLFDKKHATLWRISMWMNSLAPIILLIFTILAIGEVSRYMLLAHNQYQTDLLGLFSKNRLHIFDISLQAIRMFLQGAFYYAILKGVALGLDMIVETDINYREKAGVGEK